MLLSYFYTHLTAIADVLYGHVVRVADGDTITIIDKDKIQYIIRLSGIDAPEKKQAFGNKAKQSLSELVFDKDVQITWFKKDRYGRTIGKVEIDNMDICLEQIKRGLAWHYKHYERDQTKEDKLRYSNAENDAKTNNLGLWMNENPIRHSDFRRGN